MPNHCESDLKIKGPIKEIEAFFAAVQGKGFNDNELMPIDCDKIIPYPKKFRVLDQAAADFRIKNPNASYSDAPSDGYNQGGYDWCVANWGTKWGMYEFSEVIYSKTSASVSFQSAWAPPLPVIIKASELFPKIVFMINYYECGAGYKGSMKCQGGIVLSQKDSKYKGDRGG